MILIILFYHDKMSCSDAHRVAFFFPLNTNHMYYSSDFFVFPYSHSSYLWKALGNFFFLRFFVFDDYYNYYLTKWDVSRRK